MFWWCIIRIRPNPTGVYIPCKSGGLSSGATLGTSWSRTRESPTSMWPGPCSARAGTRRRCSRKRRSSSPRWDLNRCHKSFGKEAFCRSLTMAGKKYFLGHFLSLNRYSTNTDCWHLVNMLTGLWWFTAALLVEQWLWPWENTDTMSTSSNNTIYMNTFICMYIKSWFVTHKTWKYDDLFKRPMKQQGNSIWIPHLHPSHYHAIVNLFSLQIHEFCDLLYVIVFGGYFVLLITRWIRNSLLAQIFVSWFWSKSG